MVAIGVGGSHAREFIPRKNGTDVLEPLNSIQTVRSLIILTPFLIPEK